jgi:hypothetical protein
MDEGAKIEGVGNEFEVGVGEVLEGERAVDETGLDLKP